ncbi:MAG: NAD(P)/FAD-dependent oxidoreductase [Deltaproteobacteria bacterium]|nr:NAD(P)/FAD-dependent oxidoreductase [Deltaproteobacteria bacterium]MBW2359266.1 NAD(P)/FAD-dependent oxidoreductase [Deltaproteobacteria bacterium]
MPDSDVIVIGAGHNGLAAAAVLAGRGLEVLVLEKNGYVGGMTGTREILAGCRNEVGASCLFPLSRQVVEALDFEGNGAEFIDLPIMATNLPNSGAAPLLFYSGRLRQLAHIVYRHGPSAMLGFVRLVQYCKYPASVMDRFTPGRAPRSAQELLSAAPNAAAREQLELAFNGSAMDLIDRFFPDPVKHRTLRALLSFAAIQSTYKGPYSPGSAMCLVYTLSQDGEGGLMRRVKGGMGSLSEALTRSIEAKGGEVRLKQMVKCIVVENAKAVGVELKNGERLTARVVLSNLDKPATFLRLLGEEHLPGEYVAGVRKIEHRGAWVHLLFKLDGLPEYGGEWSSLNRDIHARFGGAMVPDPEEMQASYEACLRGELPEHVPVAFQIPSVMDSSLAPEGCHIASAYGFFFPCEAPDSERGKLRDEMAERVIDRICQYLPDFRERIVERAVFSSDHFAAMHGATNGDFTHGLIHPEQMLAARAASEGSAHATPLPGLYLCGSACHPGPGVTFLPGYNCAHEVIQKEFA